MDAHELSTLPAASTLIAVLREQRARAEDSTDAAMAACVSVMSDEEPSAIARATPQMFEALEHPVPVAV